MHVAEQSNGSFYRPLSVGTSKCWPKSKSKVPASIPDDVCDAIWDFLKIRASFLMSAPGLDMKTYAEHPAKDRLSDHENPEIVSVNTFSDAHTWPPRWGQYERRFSEDSVMGQVYSLMQKWLVDLQVNRATNGIPEDVFKGIGQVIGNLYFGARMHVCLPERRAPDQDGYCLEDIELRTLRDDVQSDLAEFACTAHNAMIELLHWLDLDIPNRIEAIKARDDRYRKERDIEAKMMALTAREKRHAAAVKRVKDKLAKEKAEIKQLLDQANERMKEAMVMANLIAKTEN